MALSQSLSQGHSQAVSWAASSEDLTGAGLDGSPSLLPMSLVAGASVPRRMGLSAGQLTTWFTPNSMTEKK